MGMKVPDVLLSGNHAKIAVWREEMAARRTRKNRPDLDP
jgi:tRNA (guanine37-N1)-methyltransferase